MMKKATLKGAAAGVKPTLKRTMAAKRGKLRERRSVIVPLPYVRARAGGPVGRRWGILADIYGRY